jgi:polysaccharide export outer membrane protein
MMALCMMTLAGAAGLLLTGCEDVNSGPQLPPIHASGSGPVTLGEGDVIKLFFPGASEYSSSQKVRTDGKLSLPLVGEIQAAGKTLPRLQAELTERYKPKLQNSEVVVSLDASGSPVIISGAIASPGKFLFERPTTLLEAIMGAGGFTDYAKRKKVRLIRLVNGQYHTDIYDMSGGLNGRPTPVVYVKGGDVVYIPQSNW